jgi:hypothetical protein
MKKIFLDILPDGSVRMVANDFWQPLIEKAATVQTRRVSHVEPTADGRQWEADLSPIGGPKLGPFVFRESALRAELDWLEKNINRIEGGNNDQ